MQDNTPIESKKKNNDKILSEQEDSTLDEIIRDSLPDKVLHDLIEKYGEDSESLRAAIESYQYTQETLSIFSGPLPSPETLKAYVEIDESFAERIVCMAEKEVEMTIEQMKHRHAAENEQLNHHRLKIVSDNNNESRGQIFGFLLALITIIGGIYLVAIGKDISGLALIIAPLTTLVAAFIYTKNRENQNNHDEDIEAKG